MNRYPLWKYAILVFALLIGLIYTAPNLFGEAPAVQVSSAKATLKLDAGFAPRVQQLLEQVINPGLASHGGFATLVGVDDDNKVYITLGGGCQGCGQADVTLREGIERTLLERIPELKGVRDVTDHTQKENAYY